MNPLFYLVNLKMNLILLHYFTLFVLITLTSAAEADFRLTAKKTGSEAFLLNLDSALIGRSSILSDLEQPSPSTMNQVKFNDDARSVRFSSDEWSNLSLSSSESTSPIVHARQNSQTCPYCPSCLQCAGLICSLVCAYLFLAFFLTIVMIFANINLPDGLHF